MAMASRLEARQVKSLTIGSAKRLFASDSKYRLIRLALEHSNHQGVVIHAKTLLVRAATKGDKRALTILVKGVKELKNENRYWAVEGCRELAEEHGIREAIPSLGYTACHEPDYRLRRRAVQALSNLADAGKQEPIRWLKFVAENDKTSDCKDIAVSALIRLAKKGNKDIREYLIKTKQIMF